jgi:hypothetical protein
MAPIGLSPNLDKLCDNWLSNKDNGDCTSKIKIKLGELSPSCTGAGCSEFRYHRAAHGNPDFADKLPAIIGAIQQVVPNCTLYKFSSNACQIFAHEGRCLLAAVEISSKLPKECTVQCTGNSLSDSATCRTATTPSTYTITKDCVMHQRGPCYDPGTECSAIQHDQSWKCQLENNEQQQKCCYCGFFSSSRWGVPGKGCEGACPKPSPVSATSTTQP